MIACKVLSTVLRVYVGIGGFGVYAGILGVAGGWWVGGWWVVFAGWVGGAP